MDAPLRDRVIVVIIGLPTDLDAAVVFLLSGGSTFITGQVLAVNGGWSVRDASGDS